MRFSDAEEFFKRLRKRPVWTITVAMAVVAAIAGGAWLTSYFSEKGKRAAEFLPPKVVATGSDQGAVIELATTEPVYGSEVAEADKKGGLSVEQLTVGAGSVGDRIDVALRNASADAVLITNVDLSAATDYALYSTLDRARLCGLRLRPAGTPMRIRAVGTAIRGRYTDSPKSGFTYPLSGRFEQEVCENKYSAHFRMGVAIRLPPKSLTVLHILIPKTLTVNPGKDRGPGPSPIHETPLSEFEKFKVRVDASGKKSAAFAFERPDQFGRDLRDLKYETIGAGIQDANDRD